MFQNQFDDITLSQKIIMLTVSHIKRLMCLILKQINKLFIGKYITKLIIDKRIVRLINLHKLNSIKTTHSIKVNNNLTL